MKPATSWSQQEAARQKCPKRFYLNYLDPSGVAAPYRRLKSVRQLGGHVVHDVLAKVVLDVANGGHISDRQHADLTALQEFDRIVERSQKSSAWTIGHPVQVAEFHNGQDPSSEIEHWRTLIPRCVENGMRAMYTLGLRSNAGDYSLQAEQEIRFHKDGREHRCVIDVLVCDGKNRVIIDWKCHEPTNSDLQQVRFYQNYVSKAEQIPVSRMYGFVVDLVREDIMPVSYQLPVMRSKPLFSRKPSIFGKVKDPYPARPSQENCARCPFAAICGDSAIRPPASASGLFRGEWK